MNRFVLKQYSQKNNCSWKAIITIYCLWKTDWKITFIHYIIILSYEGPRNVRPHFLYRRFNIFPPFHFIPSLILFCVHKFTFSYSVMFFNRNSSVCSSLSAVSQKHRLSLSVWKSVLSVLVDPPSLPFGSSPFLSFAGIHAQMN